MRRAIAIWGMAVLGSALAWSPGPAGAASVSTAQDPAQLSTAAVVFVKVDPASATETILVVNRQQAKVGGVDVTTRGTALTVHLRFYDSTCHLRFDAQTDVTPQGVNNDDGDINKFLITSLFGASEPGVVLATLVDPNTPASASPNFGLGAVVLDGNFGAVYERRGLPLLQPNPRGTSVNPFLFPSPVWGGFSNQDIDDWFIGGFTMLQMICPGLSELALDMERLAGVDFTSGGTFANTVGSFTRFGSFFPVVNVYDTKEILKRSIHNVDCFCNTDSTFFKADSRAAGYGGDFADILVSMKAVGVGTFHWDDPDGDVVAWRVTGDGHVIYWDAQLRRTPGSNAAPEGFND